MHLGLQCTVAGASFYSWLDFMHEDPGTQLEIKLYWSAFLKIAVLFCNVMCLSLKVGSSSSSALKVPSLRVCLPCFTRVESFVRFQWNQSIPEGNFFPEGLVLVLCWVLQCLFIFSNWPIILTLVLMSALVAKFACFISLNQTRAQVEPGRISLAEVCLFSWVGELSDCIGEMHNTSSALLRISVHVLKK